jgi:DNA-binding transcriptional MerR regulator
MASESPAGAYTIDELAHKVGMTVRNVRAHQSRGLLPPPAVKGRTGYYGTEHVARLELIREMQGSGFNLQAIKHVLEMAPEGSGEALLNLERSLMAPWTEEAPEYVTLDALVERFGPLDPKLLARSQALGILRDIGDGRFEVVSPALFKAGAEVVALGIPLDHALALTEKVHRQSKAVAKEFVRLFLQDVWRPFLESEDREERLPQVTESLERLRALSTDVLTASFMLNMAAEVEQAFGKVMSRPQKKAR